jgi:thiol-disulfide isomerase/thioredoxin
LVIALLLSAGLFAAAMVSATADFQLEDIKGQTHRLSDYRGKWLVVNYWATWCPPCLEEIPELEVFHNNHKDKDAVVLGINMENIGDKALHRFVEDQFISYPVIKTRPASKSVFGRIMGMPTTYLVNPEGEVVARQEGGVTAQDLESFIKNYKQ